MIYMGLFITATHKHKPVSIHKLFVQTNNKDSV